jgi:hypothetical protein
MRTKNADHKVGVQVYWVSNRREGEMNDYGGVVHSNIREGYIRDTSSKHKGGRKVCIET